MIQLFAPPPENCVRYPVVVVSDVETPYPHQVVQEHWVPLADVERQYSLLGQKLPTDLPDLPAWYDESI